jgi:heat shock protein HslJ
MSIILNPISFASLASLLISLLMSGCASVQHVNETSLQQLKNLSYQGIYANPVTLKDGVYEGQPFVTGGDSRPRVQLVEQLMVSGDMTDDGFDEAAVFLTESAGGSGSFTYLAIVSNSGSNYQNIATRNLGDRVQVRALQLAEGTLILDFITAGPDDAMCCPSMKMRTTYRLVENKLQLISDKQMGPLGLQDLEGVNWSLLEFAQSEPVPAEVPVDAMFEQNRVSGSSGCNRYFAEIKGSSPYQIKIGPVAGTRMMCPAAIMQVEDRYLATLGKVGQFGFSFGRLMLGYKDNGKDRRMLFNPGPAEAAQ